MRIPNSFFEQYNDSKSEFIVACALYALINARTRLSRNGYEICVKQETLAFKCRISLATVRRVLSRLEEKGLITHKYRTENAVGDLGTYHYSVKVYSLKSNYTYVDSYYLSRVPNDLFYFYCLFCRLADSRTHRFYQSLRDLQSITGFKRSRISGYIKRMIQLNLIRKRKKRTRCGDYAHNVFTVATKSKGNIRPKIKPLFDTRVSHNKGFVKRFLNFFEKIFRNLILDRKKRTPFSFRGGG